MLKGMRLPSGASLLAANMTEIALPFLRSIALAHIIAKDQFGLAITLAAAAGMAETMTDMGIQYSAVRNTTAASPDRNYATLHAIALMRSAFVGLALVAAAPIIALALDAWHALWAFMVLGLVAVVRGFTNLGIKELMRKYVFWPEAAAIIGAQVAWTVGAIVTAWILRDYSCMIWGLLGAVATTVLLSHLLSPRRWRLGWDTAVAKDVLEYGRPLVPTGIANAVATLGDRFIVGSALGVSTLATWNVAMTTAVLPRGMVLKLLVSVFMPAFVNLGMTRAANVRFYDRWLACLSVIAFCYALGLMAVGRPALGIMFGTEYQPTQLLMSLIAIDTCIKFFAGIPVPSALAFGHTRFVFWGAISACLALLAASPVIVWTRSLEIFVAVLAACEFIALVWILNRSIATYGFGRRISFALVLLPIGALCALAALHHLAAGLSLAAWIAICCLIGLVVVGAMIFALKLSGLPPRKLFLPAMIDEDAQK